MKTTLRSGTSVTVSDRDIDGHMRTPTYIRGKTGVIERCCGWFRNPETMAYGGDGSPKRALYRVRFLQNHVWPEYSGVSADTVDLEIFEHWLELDS